jgi:uncharacterized protein (TIGR03435 family)
MAYDCVKKLQRMRSYSLIYLVVLSIALAATAQTVSRPNSFPDPTVRTFDAVTIKPASPQGMIGFLSYPGGRVLLGNVNLRRLLHYALDTQDFEIVGGQSWIDTERFDIIAVRPPDTNHGPSPQQNVSATPTADERKMILALVLDRFALKYHAVSKESAVYFLSVDHPSPLLVKSKDTTLDQRGGLGIDSHGVPNGDIFGQNLGMARLARYVSEGLQHPVLDRTGMEGAFDFRVRAAEPNEGDAVSGILLALKSIGLTLKSGKATVQDTVIDRASLPTID